MQYYFSYMYNCIILINWEIVYVTRLTLTRKENAARGTM